MSINKTFENQYCRLEIKDDIMYADYKEVVIALPDAKKMLADRIMFQQREHYDCIPLVHHFKAKYVNKAARKYLGDEGVVGLNASAFIVKTLAAKTLVNIFLFMEKPKLPIRVFEDELTAVNWIKGFVEK